MDNIIDGREVSTNLRKIIKDQVSSDGIKPNLSVIQVGDDKASNIYVKNKKRACEEVGITFDHYKFDDGTKTDVIIDKINKLNSDKSVNGILIQLPLPDSYDEGVLVNLIDPLKDVDGLTYENIGNLVLGNECLVPCTPLGVMELLKAYDVKLEGKSVCIVGRSNLVGRPLIQLLLQKNATVSICHSKTYNLEEYTKNADILIVAVGHPKLITKDMVKEGSVVIDVGINKLNDKLCGDVDFNGVSQKASLITPVPGGVGPMTVSCLLKNVVKACEIQKKYSDSELNDRRYIHRKLS